MPLVRRQPITTLTVRKWTPDPEAVLRDCFSCTDWSVLLDPHGQNIEEATQCLTDYINFCTDIAVPAKEVRCFANNKPWITGEVKAVLNRKKRAFRNKDTGEIKIVQKELKICSWEAKKAYKNRLEGKLRLNNIKQVWDGMKTITGCKEITAVMTEGSVARANELNTFFNRFNSGASSPATTTSSAAAPPPVGLSPPPSSPLPWLPQFPQSPHPPPPPNTLSASS